MREVKAFMKRRLAILLAVLQLLAVFAAMPVVATDTSGSTSSTVYWSLSDGTLTIVGWEGEPEFAAASAETCPWLEYANQITTISLRGVDKLCKGAFAGCVNLTNADISGLQRIPEELFKDCTALESVNGEFISIGTSAFEGCTALRDLGYRGLMTVESIGDRAFARCTSLESLDIPENVKTIGKDAFANIEGLTLLINTSTAKEYAEQNGISYNILNPIYWDLDEETGMLTLSPWCHYEGMAEALQDQTPWLEQKEKVRSASINVKLPAGALAGCVNLTKVWWTGGGMEIPRDMFKDCAQLEEIDVPECIGEVQNAFEGCTGLKKVVFSSNINQIENGTFLELNGLVLQGGGSVVKEYAQTNNVAWKAARIYWSLDRNGTLTLTVYNDSGESQLETTVAEKPWLARKDEITALYLNGVTEVCEGAFADCANLAKVTTTWGLTMLPKDAFRNCTALKSFTIPMSANTVQDAFSGCTGLKVVSFERAWTEIEEGAFVGLDGLMFTLSEDESDAPVAQYAVSHNIPFKVGSPVYYCMENGKLTLSSGYMENAELTTNQEKAWQAYKEEVTAAEVRGSVPAQTFSDFVKLKDVDLSKFENSNLPSGMFKNCTALEELVIPNGVTSLNSRGGAYGGGNGEDSAFLGCNSLKFLTLPGSLQSIGSTTYDSETQTPLGTGKNLTIKGYDGTYAQMYAQENGIPFVSLGQYIPETPDEDATFWAVVDGVLTLQKGPMEGGSKVPANDERPWITHAEEITSVHVRTESEQSWLFGPGYFEGLTNLREIHIDGFAEFMSSDMVNGTCAFGGLSQSISVHYDTYCQRNIFSGPATVIGTESTVDQARQMAWNHACNEVTHHSNVNFFAVDENGARISIEPRDPSVTEEMRGSAVVLTEGTLAEVPVGFEAPWGDPENGIKWGFFAFTPSEDGYYEVGFTYHPEDAGNWPGLSLVDSREGGVAWEKEDGSRGSSNIFALSSEKTYLFQVEGQCEAVQAVVTHIEECNGPNGMWCSEKLGLGDKYYLDNVSIDVETLLGRQYYDVEMLPADCAALGNLTMNGNSLKQEGDRHGRAYFTAMHSGQTTLTRSVKMLWIEDEQTITVTVHPYRLTVSNIKDGQGLLTGTKFTPEVEVTDENGSPVKAAQLSYYSMGDGGDEDILALENGAFTATKPGYAVLVVSASPENGVELTKYLRIEVAQGIAAQVEASEAVVSTTVTGVFDADRVQDSTGENVALEETKKEIVINATAETATEIGTANVQIEAITTASLADTEAIQKATIKTNVANVTFDSKALQTIAETEDTVHLSVTVNQQILTTPDSKDRCIVNLNLYTDEGKVVLPKENSAQNGSVTVTVPYTKADASGRVVVYYRNGLTGEMELIQNAEYDEKTKTVTFTTTHFSEYVIQEQSTVLSNDINNDGSVDVFDALALMEAVAAETGDAAAMDFNEDGAVDVFDVLWLMEMIASQST